MENIMLLSALHYHNENLCIIPVVERDKRPAIDWLQYQTERSTRGEIIKWFSNGHNYNIGCVHGPVSDNFISIDIDHDSGIYTQIVQRFPALVGGRIEQSGSGEGYHIPLKVEELPDFGNRTWKTSRGSVNIRCRNCQTVLPPSIHPSGRRYRFIKKGDITRIKTLESFMFWLDKMAPGQKREAKQPSRKPVQPAGNDSLLEAVKEAWRDVITIFEEFGRASDIEEEKDGQFRLHDNGGLLVTPDKQQWFCFEQDIGGGIFEAWGWCKYGTAYDKKQQFRQVLLEMAQAAGIDTAKFYRQGDEQYQQPQGDTGYWARQYAGMWERAR